MKLRNIPYCLILLIVLVSCSNSGNQSSFSIDDDYKDVVLGEDLVSAGMPERLDYLINNLVISD